MTITQPTPTTQEPPARTVGRQLQSLTVMVTITAILLGGIGSRLAYLQLAQGDRNRQLADTNRIRLIPQQPERGRILDRQGRVLAGSRLSYAVFLWPIANSQTEWNPIVDRIAEILKVPPADIHARLDRSGYTSPYLVRIARGISPAEATALAELSDELSGVQVQAEAVRNYPYGDLAAHVLGYTGEVTAADLQQRSADGYRFGDVIGQMGIEAAFEPQLRGVWGGQQVEVDGGGRVLQVLGERPAQAGQDVRLTLDLDVQRSAEVALGNRRGAIVAIDPRNGAVLAMVSRPTFDPNFFSTHLTDTQRQQLQNQSLPFVNRALQAYSPASPFKIVTTTAAIESGSFAPDSVLATRPYVAVGGNQFWDWNRKGFGSLGFVSALALNSDTFFYQAAMQMGDRPLIQWSRRFGFGQKTGIELAQEESPGLVPDPDWKRSQLRQDWQIGDTLNLSIGQGSLKASPLQVAVMFSAVANGGDRVQPHLLMDNEAANQWREPLNISSSTIEVLQQGLQQVATSDTDPAIATDNLPEIAAQGGTAIDSPHENHTWYGAYAPAENPEIVVVAVGENSGGESDSIAAPMVKQVLESYFNTEPAAGEAIEVVQPTN
ncbi:penicillin-binding protein 2 [Microcoleus sp. FACHB-1515]|uniref:penicillin-binding protein 2 n=1 Tax=Cyanophyceae TaxID=3028117 RepID=UPI0016884808|nr:penicillin-binding protein 2 [Microcoleus sp. FACHB-1515]MBD2091010.1 penicillin-binding protein 2 [Microcoleus sp. FACHB-1515]